MYFMNILEAIVLGIIQGLTEFLPVSSSGHLVLFQNIFALKTPPMFFDIMLHIATLAAVVLVMRKEVINLFKRPFRMLIMLVIATIPAVIFALFFDDFITSTFSGAYLGLEFILTALILAISEYIPPSRKAGKNGKGSKEIKPTNALFMGAMQAIAILPGISRSGSTIAGGLFCRLDRAFVARFSFLMSIPAIIGSFIFELPDIAKNGIGEVSWLAIIIGMLFAAVCGIFAIRFMIAQISKRRLYPFAIYTAALGLFILCDQLFFHLFMPALF